jgi:hypothetical protein
MENRIKECQRALFTDPLLSHPLNPSAARFREVSRLLVALFGRLIARA